MPENGYSKESIFQSQRRLLSFLPTECTLSVDVPKPRKIYLLLNADYLYKEFKGKPVGEIKLEFSNGLIYDVSLIAWENIRSIVVSDSDRLAYSKVNITGGDIQIRNVWAEKQIRVDAGQNIDYWAWMDMITIPLPEKYQFDTLEKITVKDISVDTLGSQDPSLVLVGITVEGGQ